MKNYFDVKGRFALVTGASSGLGRQFALCLAEQGANVAVAARRLDRLEELKKEIEAMGVRCLAIRCDITDSKQVAAMVEQTEREFGRIDILINNVGLGTAKPATEFTDEEWGQMMDTNVNGLFYVARETAKVMLRQKYGKIINIGSIHCQITMNGFPRSAYTTTKGAVGAMTRALASEWAKSGITVNTLGPGFFATEMTARDMASESGKESPYVKMVNNNCPMGCFGKPEELNGIMLYFASDASSYCTGQLMCVDGGWVIV